jgi:hypothetical protein
MLITSDEEAARRRDELAKRILRMPPQPRKPSSSRLAIAVASPQRKGASPKRGTIARGWSTTAPLVRSLGTPGVPSHGGAKARLRLDAIGETEEPPRSAEGLGTLKNAARDARCAGIL